MDRKLHNKLVFIQADLGKNNKNIVRKAIFIDEADRYLKCGWKFLNYEDEEYYKLYKERYK